MKRKVNTNAVRPAATSAANTAAGLEQRKEKLVGDLGKLQQRAQQLDQERGLVEQAMLRTQGALMLLEELMEEDSSQLPVAGSQAAAPEAI